MKRSIIWIASAILSLGIFSGNSQAESISGPVIWTAAGNPHLVTENLTIASGGSLTIESGSLVKLSSNVQITVNSNGFLDATGATFTWADGVNEWRGIYFYISDSRNRLVNCTIEHAEGLSNSTAYGPGMILMYSGGGSPLIQGCTIGNGTAINGINVAGVSPQILNNTISGFSGSGVFVNGTTSTTITGNQFSNNAAGVHIDYGTGTDPTVANNTYSGNSQGDVRTDGSIYVNTAWNEAAGTVYRVVSSFNITTNASLTISEGIIVKLNPNVVITVNDTNGFLDATGATFTWADGVNEWKGIDFFNAHSSSRLVNCTIEHAKGLSNSTAYDPGMILIFSGGGSPLIQGCTIGNGTAINGINVAGASPQILNSTISGFSGSGVFVNGTTSTTITGNQFSNNAAGVHIDYGTGTDPTVANNTYSGNSQGDVRTDGSIYVNTAWNEAAGTVYRVVSSFNIATNASLTISEGIIVKLNPNVVITVNDTNGFLDATGATFTWADGVNEWKGIDFFNAHSSSRLVNCTIEHAKGLSNSTAYDPGMILIFSGGGSPLIQGCTIGNGTAINGINVAGASPQILNSTISGFSGSGIFVYGTTGSTLVAGNLITGNNRGVWVSGGAAGLYRVNRIQSNTEYGFYNGNSSSSPSINAKSNWWGSSSGPTIASNPLGTGDRITTKVDYFPFFGSTADTDADGMWDEWEVQHFTNLTTASATSDYDQDGLLDKDEFLYGTDPKNRDSDGDGVEDGLEVQAGMNPTLAGDYNIDSDGDTYSNLREIISGTDPYNPASVPPVLSDGDPLPSGDGDVDGKDLAGLISEFGRTDCAPCKYDLDTDGDVDLADLFLFSEDFGRTTP